jgi:glycosyltransferase involved in cell wall biosynthesis
MRILVPMTYYRPYVSGPIVYMDNLGAELARRGHCVTFLTSRHDPASCPQGPDGLRVERARVWARLSKGVVMPGFLPLAATLLREHDVLLIQSPQLEAPALAALARAVRKPAILTWHCDVQLPPGLLNRAIERALAAGSRMATRLSTRVVAYTEDYARHSPVLSRALGKVEVIPPPVELAPPGSGAAADFRSAHGLEGCRAIGICGRMSSEKGFERLLDALPAIMAHFPNVVVLHAGEAREVAGESAYRQRLESRIAGEGRRWRSLGVLGRHELAAFYAACDVTVLPSLNRTESFGLVQVESMLSGTPVVASALPGVRVPITVTGMGITVPPGEAGALAEAIVTVLESPDRYRRPRAAIEAEYSVARTADGYERLLHHVSRLAGSTA